MTAAPESKTDSGYLYEEEVVRAVKPGPGAAGTRGSLVTMVLVIFLTGLAVAYYYSQLYTLNYRMDSLQTQLNALQASTQDLDASVSRYSSLDYVEEVATTRLGMVRASGQRALTVSIAPQDTVTPRPAAASSPQPEKQVYAQGNPLIDVFYQMVSRFEQKIKNG